MLVPVIVFVGCLSAGVIAAARWLPDLAEGRLGGGTFFLVCGLLGMALALAGLRIYSIVEAVDRIGGGTQALGKGEIVASGLGTMVWEVGSLVALATVVYLLAPPPPELNVEI